METNYFFCDDVYNYLGYSDIDSTFFFQNTSAFDIELFISDTELSFIDPDLSGFRIQPNETFNIKPSVILYYYVRNWFPNHNTKSFGVVLLSDYIPRPPKITGFLKPGSTSFDFETDLNEKFIVSQGSTILEFLGDGSTAVNVPGLNDSEEISIELVGSNSYFKFRSDDWLSLNLAYLGNIIILDSSFYSLTSLVTFLCSANLKFVTSFKSAWFNCSSLLTFPFINISSATDLDSAWRDCSSLLSFPQLDFSNCLKFYNTWSGCSALLAFPNLNSINGTHFQYCFFNCSNLICIASLDFTNLTSGSPCFTSPIPLIQPPVTGSSVRDYADATVGKWSNPNLCP